MTSASLEVSVCAGSEPGRDRELDAFFAACPTSFAQQTPSWRDVIASRGVDEPLFLICRRDAGLVGVLPAYRFEGPLGAILCSCAQAGPLGGVACLPGAEREAVFAALLSSFLELARARDCALATVITNPLWPDRELCERHLRPDFLLENLCQVLDLERDCGEDGSLPRAATSLRRNLRRAASAGFAIDDRATPETVAEWYELHAKRQGEIGAPALPADLVRAALEHMVPRERARFFFVRDDSGALLAGGLYVYHQQVIDALMPAVASEHADRGAGFALALHSILWARERGLRYYNWQASPPGGGVYRFKRQWGSRDVPYTYATRVVGNAEPFLTSSIDELRSGYPWHYALPFDRIGSGAGSHGPSSRDSAWKALDEAGR